MYGCIVVMKTTPVDMSKELFVEQIHRARTAVVISGSEAEARDALPKARTPEERVSALSKLLKYFFDQKNFFEALFQIDVFIRDTSLTKYRAYLLFKKGQAHEFLYQYNDALMCYCRALASPLVPKNIYALLWNNVGFCWLYLRDFKNAEPCFRRAIELSPHFWEALKNLGACLEYQGNLQEAVDAYVKALNLSKANALVIMHLWRFDKRYPGLLPEPVEKRERIYKEYRFVL